jgi:hypothetical protein
MMTQVLAGIGSKTDFELVRGQDIYLVMKTGIRRVQGWTYLPRMKTRLALLGNKAALASAHPRLLQQQLLLPRVSSYRVQASTPD